MEKKYDHIIIGAGMCGLTLAKSMKQAAQNFLILEKSKAVGGRLATRRDEDSTFDHGAQFVKSKKGHSLSFDELWIRSGLKKLWFTDDQHDYFCSLNGMTSLPKEIAKTLPLQLSEKVLQIKVQNSLWHVHCESEQVYQATTLYLTAPVPQALEILSQSNIAFPEELRSVSYAKSLVGLFEFEDQEELRAIHYLKNCSKHIFSIANQNSKGISKNLAFTVVMQPDFSSQNFLNSDADTMREIEIELKKFFNFAVVVKKSQFKKWRYSHPTKIFEQRFLMLDNPQKIFLMGDGFGGPHIHGACKSAQAVIDFLRLQY